MLKEHYRCHPKIIEFCNQKFYDNQLITLSTDKGQKDVIKAISTPAGNHARNHLNQREIDVIINEILPDLSHIHPSQIGIITPYNQQKAALIAKLHPEIEIDTIHKFQGREKQAIILTSVDNEINDFINDKKILNVAISRAKRYLYLVYCPQFCKSQNHYNDFIAFIQYHRFETKPSQVKSIFDLLYKANQKARIAYLKGKKRISNYESENLLSALLDEILLKDSFSSLCYAVHIPLSRLVNDVENLQEMAWIDFINNTLTHIDFVIYHKFNKKPILCIEVDGFIYHQSPKQQKRDTMKDRILEHYGIALLRLPTTGSQEARIIEERLNSLL